MENEETKKHGLENEPLGNEKQDASEGPQSFEDNRPADPELPKGDHVDTDTSMNPEDVKAATAAENEKK